MRSKLCTFIMAPAVLAAASLVTIPAIAESTSVKVPFSFIVNGRTLPAGMYSVERDTDASFVRLQGKYSSQTFTWIASPNAAQGDRAVLRFEKQGQVNTLQSIQYGPLVTPRLDKKTWSAESEPAQNGQGQ